MGYTLHGIAPLPPNTEVMLKGLDEDYKEVCKERWAHGPLASQEVIRQLEDVGSARRDLEARSGNHFDLNGAGMYVTTVAMGELGMAYDAGEHPSWPARLSGEAQGEYEATEDLPITDTVWHRDRLDLSPEVRKYMDELHEVLAWNPDPTRGIAAHKFSTNDEWVVTPEEIKTALLVYYEGSGPEVRDRIRARWDWWDRWIMFLEANAAGEGFTVD